jgi:hypothetical protein
MYFVAKPNEEAKAFIQAAGLIDETQCKAVGTLVIDLKNYNLWNKMQAIYPMVGGTSGSIKFNLKDPRDLDAAFRLNYTSGYGYSTLGYTGNASTNFSPEISSIRGNRSFGVYTRTSNPVTLVSNGSTTNPSVGDFIVPSDPIFRFGQGYNATSISSVITSSGFYAMSRVPGGSHAQTIFLNGILIGSGSAAEQTNYPLSNPTTIGGTSIAFAYFSAGLTDTDAANLYTAVQRFQTTLGRQV